MELSGEGPEHTLLLDADDVSEPLRFHPGGRVLLFATPPAGVRVNAVSPADPHEFGGDESWSFYPQDEKQAGAYLSPRMRPGTYAWSRETGTRREGTIEISPGSVTVVDIR